MKVKKSTAITILIIISIITTLILIFINKYIRNIELNTIEYVDFLDGNDYDLSKLKLVDNRYIYEDDEYDIAFGIDVSQHQKDIDFKKVKEDGVEFVFIRLGYRGYSEGKIYLDSYFEKNYKEAKDAGLKIGFYFFSQAINQKEAIEEADFVLKHIKNKIFELPIVFDYEDPSKDSRINHLTREERTEIAISFMERIKRNNYHHMLYTNLYWLRYYYDIEKIMNYDIWFAQYHDKPTNPYKFNIWQYSDKGSINGINGDTDLNIMFIKKQ